MELARRKILVGMTGGIAAYKVCELVRRLQDAGATVQVVMTAAAQQFVTATTMQALSGKPVFADQWGTEGGRVDNAMPHVDLTRGVDAIVVAPATAQFIAKTALGLADDLLSTLVLARNRAATSLLVVPAMNVEMWSNPATQRNVKQLIADGVSLLGPAAGDQACGEVGPGRMLEPHELLEDIIASFQPQSLRGKHVLLTAGPTFEPIDPVRGIANLSSGKTGFALARAARQAGASITLIAGPTSLSTPRGVHRVDVQTAAQMLAAVKSALPADIFISVAAVADWRIAKVSASKLKKKAGGEPPTLQFEQNADILATIAALPAAPFCVGFAAESELEIEHGKAKRAAKKVPLLVANRAQSALGADSAEWHLIDEHGVTTLPLADKQAQARALIAEIAARAFRQ